MENRNHLNHSHDCQTYRADLAYTHTLENKTQITVLIKLCQKTKTILDCKWASTNPAALSQTIDTISYLIIGYTPQEAQSLCTPKLIKKYDPTSSDKDIKICLEALNHTLNLPPIPPTKN